MNLRIINLDCDQWTRDDWTEAYGLYCQSNMFGPKTKRQYYDMVVANHKRLKNDTPPLSEELRSKWTNGFRKASVWAKKRKCNMYGQDLESLKQNINLKDVVDAITQDVKDIQWQLMQK